MSLFGDVKEWVGEITCASHECEVRKIALLANQHLCGKKGTAICQPL